MTRATTCLTDTVTVLERRSSGKLPQATRLHHQIYDAVTPMFRGHRASLAVRDAVSQASELSRLADAIVGAEDDAEI